MGERQPAPLVGRLVLAILAVAAAALAIGNLSQRLPPTEWFADAHATAEAALAQLRFHQAALPRLAIGLLAGGALGLAGAIMQQALRNPLAEPMTLGVSAGAYLALALATSRAPFLLFHGQEWVALAGGLSALALVLTLSGRGAGSPLRTILAGLIVSLSCSAAGSVLALFQREALIDLFIWQTGSLQQAGWRNTRVMAVVLLSGLVLASLLARPLGLLGLSDESSRSLGLRSTLLRATALSLAVVLGSSVVATVGVIGFVGLAGPVMARLAGARRLLPRLLLSALAGAILLSCADQLAQALGSPGRELPAGTITALVGAVLLIALLPRLRMFAAPATVEATAAGRQSLSRLLVLGCAASAFLAILALALARTEAGWTWTGLEELALLWPWRAPRLVAALSAGAMLAVAGTMIQRLTANPMASPEILGVGSGAVVAVILFILAGGAIGPTTALAAGTLGAMSTLALNLLLGRSAGFMPERILLIGVALATFLGALTALVLSSRDPRMAVLMVWLSGSTYRTGVAEASIAAGIATLTFGSALLMTRWLDLMPLGPAACRALGLSPSRSRLTTLILASLPTAAATLIVGPLTFVGLMAPHMARMLGAATARSQLVAASLIGGGLMVFADWLGRNIAFPWQIPAGLISTLLGAPYFLWLMRKGR